MHTLSWVNLVVLLVTTIIVAYSTKLRYGLDRCFQLGVLVTAFVALIEIWVLI